MGTWAIIYSAENRPVRFENAETQTVVECAYDSQGRRFEKKVTVAGATTLHHRYIYRGYLQIAALDLTRSAHPALWFVTWDPSQPTATRPLAIQKDGTWFTYGYDITKNICEVFGPAGYIRTSYSYAPFGAVTASGDVTQPFQWSSEHYDSELDLVYYNFRHYSPSLGRFLSRDPIEEQGGWNLYAFVGNRSLKRVDLLGTRVNSNSCVDISFTVSYSFRSKQVQVFPFLFMSVSGAFNFSAQGKLCKSCCRGKRIDRYEMGVSVSGDATLAATVGFAFSEDIDDIFSADIWGGIQAYGGGGISGTGIFSKDCAGTHGRGVGTLKGSAGLRVGAEVSFSIGRWSLGPTGVSGGGKSDVAVPFNFVCSERTCGDLSWGEASSDANLFLSACAFGICFEKTF